MKKMKKLVTMLVVAICVLLPLADAMPVSAATPYTYYVKYLPAQGTWGFQSGSSAWDDSKAYTSIVHLNTYIKDGDIVIVDGNNPNSKIDIAVNLSNLTLLRKFICCCLCKIHYRMLRVARLCMCCKRRRDHRLCIRQCNHHLQQQCGNPVCTEYQLHPRIPALWYRYRRRNSGPSDW